MPETTISCDKNDLVNAAKCYCIPDERVQSAIVIYLLAQIAENTDTPSELAKKAACYNYPDTKSTQAVILFLLCAISEKVGA